MPIASYSQRKQQLFCTDFTGAINDINSCMVLLCDACILLTIEFIDFSSLC